MRRTMRANSTTIAKSAILVEMERGKPLATPFLWEYNKQLPLADNIKQIVIHYNHENIEPLAANGFYALKVQKDMMEHFISEDTVEQDIQDGIFIKLVPSVAETVRRLFDVKMDNDWLLHLSHDLVFVQEIVEKERQDDLIKFIQNGTLTDDGESGALNIIYHLLKNGYIRNLEDEFVAKVVNIAHSDKSSSSHAISLLIHILRTNKDNLTSNRHTIMEHLKVPHIMENFKTTNTGDMDIGFYPRLFTLINALISCAKAERRKAILEELNSKENHAIFYAFLKKHHPLNDSVAREVFVLQARLMTSTYFVLYTNRATMTASIFEDSKRSSTSSDYDYLDVSNRNTIVGDGVWVSNLQKADSMCSILSMSSMNKSAGSPLLHKCLEYGKSYYHTYFDSLEKSDYSCDAELYTISQNIISILTNLLCIGIPVHAYNYYLPMYFASRDITTSNGAQHTVAFFEELFVKTLMHLFYTKAEMRVRTKDDFKKLYQVLKKQLKLVFEKHPMDFEECDYQISQANYTTLQEILHTERDQRWTKIYKENPAVRDLITHFSKRNIELIGLSRYNILLDGFVFKNMNTKGKYFSLALMSDFQSLIYVECSRSGGHIADGHKLCIPITTIMHVVHGENSNLRSNNLVHASRTHCVFTIVYNLAESVENNSIDCYFYKEDPNHSNHSSQETLKEMEVLTELWKDGLNLLTGKDISRSVKIQAELDELNELDCKMQLIELQEIEIPMGLPPPPPPFEIGGYY